MEFHEGKITYGPHDESEGEALMLGDHFLTRLLEGYKGEKVFVAYVFSSKKITPGRFREMAILSAEGIANPVLAAHYSEITGFLWLDDECHVGGHDLAEIFGSHENEYGAIVISREPIELTDL